MATGSFFSVRLEASKKMETATLSFCEQSERISKSLNSVFLQVKDRSEVEIQECKQRASIRWLVSKAYNNEPPKEFEDPFYKDYNGAERLKPNLVHALANAELYCMTLSHLYQDPNYQNLNNWGVIQV